MLIGHETQISALKKLADTHDIAHGYIFFGPSRVGKKTVAVSLAHYLEAKQFSYTTALGDCLLVQPDEKRTIGIDAVRDIKYFLSQRPNRSQYRTVVIDNGECLTSEAQNALLKISEETPESGIFLLIARDPEVLRETLRSRFQKLYFSHVPSTQIAQWLVEDHGCAIKRAESLGQQSLGAPGRAYALYRDIKFQKIRDAADAFLSSPQDRIRSAIKKLVEAEDFYLEEFLEALIEREYLSARKNVGFLSHALALRKQSAFINVNPRLQLEVLSQLSWRNT